MATSEVGAGKSVTDANEFIYTVSAVSRRRLVFKAVGRLPTIGSATQSQFSAVEKGDHSSIISRSRGATSSGKPGPSRNQAARETSHHFGGAELQKTLRRGDTWSHEEIMIYYEAIKQVGKDFDSLVKLLNKKDVRKNKEQAEHFYFNFLKFMRSLIDFDDALFPTISRETAELFVIINSLEWRKKTRSTKYQVDRLKEMIFNGSTEVCYKTKTMVFKTPACPALTKCFNRELHVEKPKLPITVQLLLKPKTYTDGAALMASCQNPLLKITVSINDRIKRIFDVLQKKWLDSSISLAKNATTVRAIRLFPAENVTLRKVFLTRSMDVDSRISLNSLKSECEQDSATDKNSDLRILTDSPFILSDAVFSSGLTLENVGDATVKEIFCLCGMTREVALTYSIDSDRMNSWTVFCSLLNRGFPEAINASDIVDGEKKVFDECHDKRSARRQKPSVKEHNSSIDSVQVQHPPDRRKRKQVTMRTTASKMNDISPQEDGKRSCKDRSIIQPVYDSLLSPATDFSQIMSSAEVTEYLGSLESPEKQEKPRSTSSYHSYSDDDSFGSTPFTPSKEPTGPFTSLDGSSDSFRDMIANTVAELANMNSMELRNSIGTLIEAISPDDSPI